ncbi:TPA: DUF4365 domain-containing protein, partial [Escherichia coli]|nr:DUF4365 domain-containing protein [Escherichia coli]
EMDFGIDGFIEIVRDDGAVTGKMLAVQIKCGASFFSEENRWGYVYRGENKHFNYLSNCPIPVLVLLCKPEKKKCFGNVLILSKLKEQKNHGRLIFQNVN